MTDNIGRFQDRVVIVTGAASGLGAECARQFSAGDARLVLVDVNADAVIAIADALPGRAVAVAGDVSLATTAAAATTAALDAFGRIDILVSNAGIDPLAATSVTGTTELQWDAVMAINVKATFLLAQAMLPVMAAGGGGAIVATGSIASLKPSAQETAYSVSKAALLQLVRCIAVDYADQNIRANCICPGYMEAVMVDRRAELSSDRLAARSSGAAASVPLGREGRYTEIARSVLFLADSADAGYITGAELVIDGGLRLV